MRNPQNIRDNQEREKLTNIFFAQTYTKQAIDADAEAVAAAEAARQSQELQGAIENVMGQVTALTEAYNEAYTAALDSISGQYALWDEAAAVVETSAGKYQFRAGEPDHLLAGLQRQSAILDGAQRGH